MGLARNHRRRCHLGAAREAETGCARLGGRAESARVGGRRIDMRMLKSPRLLAAVAVLAVILAVALWPKAIDIDIARVERGAMQVTIDEEGETRVRERFI